MKKLIYLLLFLFVTATVATAQSAEETKVADAVAALNKATVDADKNMLESLTASDLSYGHSGGKVDHNFKKAWPTTRQTIFCVGSH